MTPDVRAVLLKVRDEILTDESKWAQGDDVCLVDTPTCLGMAVAQVIARECYLSLDLNRSVRRALGFRDAVSIPEWNDAPERTFADVRARLDRALADEVSA